MFAGTYPVPVVMNISVPVAHCFCGSQTTTLPVCPHLPPCLRWSLFVVQAASAQTNWSTSFREFCCFCLLSHHRSAGLTGAHCHSLLRVGSRCFNTGSHTCTASTALYPVSHLPSSIAQCSLISNPQRFLAIYVAGCVFDMCYHEQRPS